MRSPEYNFDTIKNIIREKVDILDWIQQRVQLRRMGSGYIGLCPFHQERTPSFHVNPRLQIYKCFGCGAGGTIFRFVMETEALSYFEALKRLADYVGISLDTIKETPQAIQRKDEQKQLIHLLQWASNYYHFFLQNDSDAQVWRDYLSKRKVSSAMIKLFRLGAVPNQHMIIVEKAKKEGYPLPLLIKSGLIKKDIKKKEESAYYNPFYGRLVFPIFDTYGNPKGFGGRILPGKKGAKYLNSDNNTIYNKSHCLYGLNLAQKILVKQNEALIVEGYMDVISLHQHGFSYALASAGTSLASSCINIIRRYTNNITFIFDGDEAGKTASIRALKLCLEQDISSYFVSLPPQEDPDSFLKKYSSDKLKAYIKQNKKDSIDHAISTISQNRDYHSFDTNQKRHIISTLLDLVSYSNDEIIHPLAIQKIVSWSKDSTAIPKKYMQAIKEKKNFSIPQSSVENTSSLIDDITPCERELLSLILIHGKPLLQFIGRYCKSDYFHNPLAKEIFQDMIKAYKNNEGKLNHKRYTQDETHPWFDIVGQIIIRKDEPSLPDNRFYDSGLEHKFEVAQYALLQLGKHYCLTQRKKLEEKIPLTASPEERKKLIHSSLFFTNKYQELTKKSIIELFPLN